MFHFLLILISYTCFIGLIYGTKRKNNEHESIRLSVTLFWFALIIFALVIVYESVLQHILLHNVSSHTGFIAFAGIGSGLYMILYFAGLIILGGFLQCKLPNKWTIIFFVIALIINILLMVKSSSLYYAEIEKVFGSKTFQDLFVAMSQTKRTDTANFLLNLKWIVMISPGVFYMMQELV